MTNLLSREDLLKGDVLKKEKVELSTGYVWVREMTGKEKDTWEQSMVKKIANADPDNPVQYETTIEDFRAKLAVCTVCDEEGKLYFAFRDYKELNNKISAANLEKIVEKAMQLNGISKKDKDEMLKNLKADPEDSSNSDSASN